MKTPIHSSPFAALAAPEGPPLCGGTRAPQASAGLVLFKTSDTPQGQGVEIDQELARYKRLQRSVIVAANLFQQQWHGFRTRTAMLTLTYRDVDAFEPRHISELLKRIRQWLQRRGYRMLYVWVAELQKRGALHYHVLIWLPRGLTLPKPDKQGWWPHGYTQIAWATRPIGYLCKYVSKMDIKGGLPKGARLHGSGGFVGAAKQIRQWFNLPTWLKHFAGVGASFVRVKGVGLVDRDSGVCVPSPWRVSIHGKRVFAQKIFEYTNGLIGVAGPYSLIGRSTLLVPCTP
jgi:hypothetical protein